MQDKCTDYTTFSSCLLKTALHAGDAKEAVINHMSTGSSLRRIVVGRVSPDTTSLTHLAGTSSEHCSSPVSGSRIHGVGSEVVQQSAEGQSVSPGRGEVGDLHPAVVLGDLAAPGQQGLAGVGLSSQYGAGDRTGLQAERRGEEDEDEAHTRHSMVKFNDETLGIS